MSGILRLESLTKGNTLKQGDKTALKYKLFDADGENLNIAGKSAMVRFVNPDISSFGYEKDGLTVAQDDTVTFTIDKAIPPELYYVEIIVDGKFIFPSRADEAKFSIDKSSWGIESNIIEIVGLDSIVERAVGSINSDPSLIIDEDKLLNNVIANTGLNNIDEYYQQFNDVITDLSEEKDYHSLPEISGARGGFDTLGERLQDDNAQLEKVIEGSHERSVNAIQFGANPDNLNVDSTNAIENAISKAKTYYKGSNVVGGRGYYTGNGKLKIPAGMYRITSTISLPVGIDIDMEGAIFVAYPSDKTLDCFDMSGSGFRNNIKGGTFVGFKSAITISTNNRNVSKLVFKGQAFHMCAVGIDTVSYTESRSTLLVVKEFISYETDLLLKTHCDMTHLDDGWISHSGYDGASIYNQGFTKIENVVFVPRPPQDGARTRWIDNHSVDDGGETHGERGLTISHCRFGGEAGSMPIVYNYANADLDLTGTYNPNIISIDNSMLFSGGTLDKSYIVLFSMPNRISLKNISGGLTSLNNGAVSCDSTFDSSLVENSKFITIEIDDTVKGATQFPIVAPDLHRFLRTPDNAHTMFRRTFLDGESIKRYFSVPTTTIGSSKVTIPIKTVTHNSSVGQRNAGVAFLVSVSGSLGGSFIYKTQSLYYVSITGGASNGAKWRINYDLISSHGGGNGFTTEGLVNSIHWGLDDTGSPDKDYLSSEKNVTITMDCGTNSSIVITPIHGVDNYS